MKGESFGEKSFQGSLKDNNKCNNGLAKDYRESRGEKKPFEEKILETNGWELKRAFF